MCTHTFLVGSIIFKNTRDGSLTIVEKIYLKQNYILGKHFIFHFVNYVFNEVGYCNAVSGRAGINFWFPVKILSLFGPIETKLGVWVAFLRGGLGLLHRCL